MKTTGVVSFAFLIAIVASSCQKQPKARINAGKTSAAVNELIYFEHTSTDANTVEWEFGDGGKSLADNPSHSWSKEGTYTVTLTAFSKNENKKDKANITITINKNVSSTIVTVNNWSTDYDDGKNFTFFAEVSWSLITQNIIDNGAVLAYLDEGDGFYDALPYSLSGTTNNMSYLYTFVFAYQLGKVTFIVTGYDELVSPSPLYFNGAIFRIVAISGAGKLKKKH